jgi:uncharacterized protein YoxC
MQKSVTELQGTVNSLANHLEELAIETKQLVRKTNELAEDLQNKSRAIDSIFESLAGFGDSMKRLNNTIQSVSERVQDSFASSGQRISQIAQWGQVVLDFVARLRNRT